MRTFLVGMCDIFLILYLTSITNVQSGGVLTVEDFFELKTQHETLQADKKKAEETLKERLRREQEEKAMLLAEKQLQEELSEEQLNKLTGEKESLQAELSDEKDRLEEMEESLLLSDAERERINKELQEKQKMLRARELMLADLNEEIARQEEERQKAQVSYQQELKAQKETAQQLQDKVLQARLQAEKIEEQSQREKAEAERKAAEALAARQVAEAEKQVALKAVETARAGKRQAQRNVRILSATVKEIKQDAGAAYEKNIRGLLQTVNVTYEREIAGGITRYERRLSLLPVKVDGQVYGVFPSRQIGFSRRTDTGPDGLVIKYKDKLIARGKVNKEDDLIAVPLSDYGGDIHAPYSLDIKLKDLMPTLLALRNNGNVSFLDKVRGIADDYFIVNRDYLDVEEKRELTYDVSGFPGTGTRAERIVPGDQLVDLNGQLIGVANRANRVVRIDAVNNWDEIVF